MNDKIRILLVESHPITRLGLRAVLIEQPDLEIVGEAASGAVGIELHRELQPDITLFDLRMPDLCAVDAVKTVHEESPGTQLIILADRAGDSEVSRSLKNGACGYVLKDAPPAEFLKAIRAVAAGRKYISAQVAEVLVEHQGEEDLTPAELRVLQMIVAGDSNKEIAANLHLTENTIKTHIKNIFGKLAVDDRTAAAVTAIKRGIIRADV